MDCAGFDLLRTEERPGRSGPRAVKRRPKNFRLLTKPRREMVVERYRKKSSKHAPI